jgi:type II secretory pathway component PulF
MKAEHLPPIVTQMVAVGEQTGELIRCWKLADYYEEEADQAIANMMTPWNR